ncbi:Serine/threonine-protein kinase PrkC [Roseimaritima ulvae]|uniref:Serine/threonine-protein kinase PrkC n=2 Tax=Roseimaritima ulvae TaxID=980254 RepID=A0A5B9QLJ4_9BACT|nr:Serine/threonine-protein kinase PrkC [Roseimaritima ulvae]
MTRSRNDSANMAAALKLFSRNSGSTTQKSLRIGMRLDKYRLLKRLGCGGFATVYAAMDELENRRVALKIPCENYASNHQSLEDITREIRIMARLDHPNILRLKDARVIDDKLIMVFPMGEQALADRLCKRIARATAIDYASQMIEAVAYAHENQVLHRDIKPENFILFPHNLLCLTDFGLARLGKPAQSQSGSGTLGYVAPEQAMGKATYRSDVFSLGLVLYRMFAGVLPEYPFNPPLPGYSKLRRGLSTPFVSLIRKCIDPQPSRRFRDGVALYNAYQQIRTPVALKVT